MYRDAETSWAIESVTLRQKRKRLSVKIVKFIVSLYLHEVKEKEKLKNQLWKAALQPARCCIIICIRNFFFFFKLIDFFIFKIKTHYLDQKL